MRCLVTGSHGFVGRHFVKRLTDDGHHVVGVDDMSSGLQLETWSFSVRPFTPNIVDVRRFFDCADPDDYDLIIHCAAVVGGRAKIEGDPLAVATDLAIDSDFFNFVVRAKNRPKIVYFSSSAIYPVELQKQGYPIRYLNEDMVNWDFTIGLPDQTYGWSKLTGEYLAQQAVKKYNADVAVYRPFSGYGEDQDLAYPFSSIIRRVANREHPIEVWGSGNQVRDFIHISDIVEAVLTTKDKLRPGEVLNLGTGIATSFRDLVMLACDLAGHKSAVCPRPEQPEGVFYRVADVSKMHALYQPKVTLAEGVKRSLQFLS